MSDERQAALEEAFAPDVPPDFKALYLQACPVLAQQGHALREITEALPKSEQFEQLSIPARVRVLAETAPMLQDRLTAVLTERAHLRQELEAAQGRSRSLLGTEKRRQRAERIFLELLLGRGYEREIRELLEHANEKAAEE